MTSTFKGNFAATAIGSYPHDDVNDACSLILNTLPEIPCWPQLTAYGYQEEMCIQYTEGLPCFRIDYEKKSSCMDESFNFDTEMAAFYEKYMEKDVDYFAISKKFATGFGSMLDRYEKCDTSKLRAIKGQIVGPITLAGMTKNHEKISAINNATFFDAIVKTLAMKATWQLGKFEKFNLPTIIFVDEPYLSSIGSAFANIDKTQVIKALNEIFEAIHDKKGLAGIHCCGNTDWSVLIDTTIDIVNFDAYGYMDEALLYWREVKAFLERGGILAWGIVPTSGDIKNETLDTLLMKLDTGINKLVEKGIDPDLINRNSILTPSCGTGSLDKETAEIVMDMLYKVSKKLQERL